MNFKCAKGHIVYIHRNSWYSQHNYWRQLKFPFCVLPFHSYTCLRTKLSGKICKKLTLPLQEINNVSLLRIQETVNNGTASVPCTCPCQLEVYVLFIVIRYYPASFEVITVV